MRRISLILLTVVFGLLFYQNAFAAPTLKGDWIPFATVEGKYVGQPEELKVYYDPDSLMVKPTFASCRIWVDDPQSFLRGHVDYVMFTKQYGVWMYQAESNRQALSYKYNRTTGRYQVSSSNIPPERIVKGSIADKLFSTLYSANGEIRKEIVKYLERNEKRNEEIRRENSEKEVEEEGIGKKNRAPIILSSPPTHIEKSTYIYQVVANDPDNRQMTFTLKSCPKGMEIDKKTGLIKWEIRKEDKGNHSVEIEVSDDAGAKSVQRYTLTIDFK